MPPIITEHHTDGVNAWDFSRASVSPRLSGLIRSYYAYSERTPGFSTRREVPHAEGVLIINLGKRTGVTAGDGRSLVLNPGEGFIAGIHLRPARSHSAGEQAGLQVELPLTTLRRLTGVPMHMMTDQIVSLEAVFGLSARSVGYALCETLSIESRFALLDAWLAARLSKATPTSQRSLNALQLLRCRPQLDITQVALAVGWSRKHLANRVQDLVGVGPRTYRRVMRFGRAVSAASHQNNLSWTEIALRSGYADQPHFAREFREFAGITPTTYRARLLQSGGGLIEA